MDSGNQRRAWLLLWLSLICCVADGALRKWVVGNTSMVGRFAYLSKDILWIGFFFNRFCRSNALVGIATPFLQCGMVLLGIGAIASSLSGFDPIGGPLTIITFFVLPLAAVAAGNSLPSDAILRFARWVSILTVLICPLGILQFYAPATNAINRYTLEGEDQIATASVSDRVRATGTFAYITGMCEFGELGVWASIVVFSMAQNVRDRWLGYAGICAALCSAFVTVSRSAVLICLIELGAWVIFGGHIGQKFKTAVIIAAVALAALISADRFDVASEVASTIYARSESASKSDTISHRLWYQYLLPLYAIEISPMGDGVGSRQAASGADSSADVTFESPWGRTILELGVIGLLGFLVSLGVAFAPWKAAYQALPAGGERAALAVTGAALATRAMLGFQFNHVAAYFFWAMTACVLAMGNSVYVDNRPVAQLNVN